MQDDAGRFGERGLELALRSLASGRTDARTARLAALHVPDGRPPSPFLDAGPFEATFRGAVELDLNDWYRFTVRGSGAVRLSVGGEVVLERESLPAGGAPASTEGEVRLDKGLNGIELVYRSPPTGDASVRLSWGNDYLPEEPLPPASLRRTASAEHERGGDRRAARDLVARAMCARCHPVAGGPGAGSADAGPGAESAAAATGGASPTARPAAPRAPVDAGMPELEAAAPGLDGVGARLRREWIERWLLDPRSLRPRALMPRTLSADEAEARRQAADIAAYLAASGAASGVASGADEPAREADDPPPAGAVAEGRRLYAEIGCAACHGNGASGPAVPAAPRLIPAQAPLEPAGAAARDDARRPDLDDGHAAVRLADRWRPSALGRYLLDPTAHDPWSRMPQMELEPAEASALAAYLLAPATEGGAARSEGSPAGAADASAAPRPGRGDPDRGRRLVDELRCRGCHSLAGGEPPPPARPVGALAGAPLPWPAANAANAADVPPRGAAIPGEPDAAPNHPRYHFDAAQTAAIERFLAEDAASLSRRVPAEFAERQVRSGGCLACHARDGVAASWSPPPRTDAATGLLDAADAESPDAAPDDRRPADEDPSADDFLVAVDSADESGPDLLPPSLTWAGEKLRSDWLADFLAGRAADRPRPHLRVRMPAFPSHAEALAAGLHHQHGLPASPAAVEPVDEEVAAIGRDLVRGDRLGCHSCHALGDEPALGGEGSEETIDFALVRRRLRRPYFDRFLRDPQRILPGTKMPQFVDEDGYTGLYDVLDGEAARQFDAIWHYLGSLD